VALTRVSIVTNPAIRDQYVQGVLALKQESSGQNTSDFGIPGPNRAVSTYDLFVIWHHQAMSTLTPATGNPAARNAAHRGSVFLPWHRVMLLILEQNLQRVLGDPNFGIPYWDWAADGDLDEDDQPSAPIWDVDTMGGAGSPISTGPFAYDAGDPTSWRIRIATNVAGSLRSVNRGMRRSFGDPAATGLPATVHVQNALGLTPYDAVDWDVASSGFRNRLEGWSAEDPFALTWLHNRVHVWVGGDMNPSTSPNDPVFYLNHCNVDRIWEKWMQLHGRSYLPSANAGAYLRGHRIDDTIASPLGASATPRQVLNVSSIYQYDALP
jgi:tyrosinase